MSRRPSVDSKRSSHQSERNSLMGDNVQSAIHHEDSVVAIKSPASKQSSDTKITAMARGAPKGSKFSHACDKMTIAIIKLLGRIFPLFGRLLMSQPEEYKALKFLLGFPCGIGLGYVLYTLILSKMALPQIVTYAIGGIFTMALGVGVATTVQVRCIACLVVPTFCGKSGRSYIGTFAIAYLLSGPMTNMIFNAKEVIRALSCTTNLAVNQSKTHLQLRFKPLHDIMNNLENQGSSMKKVTGKVKKSFYPLKTEVESEEEVLEMKQRTKLFDESAENGDSRVNGIERKYHIGNSAAESEKAEKKYSEKLDLRCEDVNTMAVEACKKVFRSTEKKCQKKIKVVGKLLCLPLKLTVLCKLVNHIPGLTPANCEPLLAVNEGFGEGYDTAKQSSDNMGEQFDVNMQYQVIENVDDTVELRTPEEAAKEVRYEFAWRERWIKFVMSVVKGLLGFLFIRVVLSAHSYHKSYLANFYHDNIYVTTYFRHIDARRHFQNKRTLLPLKKIEKCEIMEPLSISMNKVEKFKVKRRTFMLILRLFMFTMIILVDSILYQILDLVKRHAHMDFRQTGSHHISLIIMGESVLGNLFRSILGAVDAGHTVDNLTTNKECLPKPLSSPFADIVSIYVVFLVSWLLVLLEGYGLRLRPVIASFFYRKQEKKRIVCLYNDMLKKRKGFLRHARNVVMRKAKEAKLYKKASFWEALRRLFPRACGCLSRMKAAKSKCLICEDLESNGYVQCPTENCMFGYCAQCWVDIKENCYACRMPEDWESSESDGDV